MGRKAGTGCKKGILKVVLGQDKVVFTLLDFPVNNLLCTSGLSITPEVYILY